MAIRKHKTAAGKTTWSFVFDAPGSSRANRKQVSQYGFSTKKDAQDAEARRRIEVQAEHEAASKGLPPPAITLSALIDAFLSEHGERNLSPKTVERYHEMVDYLSPEILNCPIEEVTPFRLTREWNRLKDCGGHKRGTNTPRPLAAKTVRNIAGMVSAAFSRGVRFGIVQSNPVTLSDLPAIPHNTGTAFTIDQQDLILAAQDCHWSLPMILEIAAATGARRGEIIALRWSDIQQGRVTISRSLCQTKAGLFIKAPKNGRTRVITMPESTIASLDAHRKRQEILRQQHGPDYRTDLDLINADVDGSFLKPDTISAAVSLLFRRLDLPPGTSLHTLRHTHGSHLLAAGIELPAVSARLGHTSPYVTATVYSHVLAGRDDEVAKAWEKFQKRV